MNILCRVYLNMQYRQSYEMVGNAHTIVSPCYLQCVYGLHLQKTYVFCTDEYVLGKKQHTTRQSNTHIKLARKMYSIYTMTSQQRMLTGIRILTSYQVYMYMQLMCGVNCGCETHDILPILCGPKNFNSVRKPCLLIIGMVQDDTAFTLAGTTCALFNMYAALYTISMYCGFLCVNGPWFLVLQVRFFY